MKLSKPECLTYTPAKMNPTTRPDGPVDTVQSMSIFGAKVMHGTWPNDETAVLISAVDPFDAIDAQLAVDADEL